MAEDIQHKIVKYVPSEISHYYGSKVHIISSPLMLSLLAKLGNPDTKQPVITDLVSELYSSLLDMVIDASFPRIKTSVKTRTGSTYEGEVINSETPCISVDLARAGTLPSQICYNKLNRLMNPDVVRQDHFYIGRTSNEDGEVTGVSVAGSKIGGDAEKSIVLFPDPMGATGSTMKRVYDHYKNLDGKKPLKMIALHLMVTPEYLKKITEECPNLEVFALRLDRGLSPKEVLELIPGEKWELEKGLNNQQYIVPGAGGLGEILNNSFC